MNDNSRGIELGSDLGLLPEVDLTPLPSSIRYWDDFADTWRSIPEPEADSWPFLSDGQNRILQFNFFPERIRTLVKHWAAEVIGRLACATVGAYFSIIAADKGALFFKALSLANCDRTSIRDEWSKRFFTADAPKTYLCAIKSFLKFLSGLSYGALSPAHQDIIISLPLPRVDKYAAVREGDVFLSLREDQLIVSYLDGINSRTAITPLHVSTHDLRAACVLCISYQYAMRPIQTARVCMEDIKIYELADGFAVHVRFFRAKQRKGSLKYAMVRKIKREWSVVFQEFMNRRSGEFDSFRQENARPDSLFGLTPAGVSQCVIDTLYGLGVAEHNSTDLRHTAAQRMVDAGASHVELAEYMGHSWADTSLVYYDVSATQAERINQALAISPVYSVLAEVAINRTINIDSLSTWPPSKQIAAVPHGIPIAGIGACELGQNLCTKNPVTSCYGCENFLPVSDKATHKSVLESLRPVVFQFYKSSRGEGYSPAYMQLRSTLESIADVIDQLDVDEHEQ